MVASRASAVLEGLRERPTDRYRDVIERYSMSDVRPTKPLPDRERLSDALTEQIRPLLDAIVEADASEAEVKRLTRVVAGRTESSLTTVARFELIGARDRRRLALARLRHLLRDEETVLRYVLLRQLVRSQPRSR